MTRKMRKKIENGKDNKKKERRKKKERNKGSKNPAQRQIKKKTKWVSWHKK